MKTKIQPLHPGRKIIFANQLRGIAALFVVVSHYVGVFWGMRDIVSQSIGAPAVEGRGYAPLTFFIPDLNYGALGVSIFFLISGFVIPFSLEKLGSFKFIIARLFRILPTYWVCLAISLLSIYCSAVYWGNVFPVAPKTLLWNSLLLHQQFSVPGIDLVNWTLCIEILFYFTVLFMWRYIKSGSVSPVIIFALAVFVLCVTMPQIWSIIQISRHTSVNLSIFKYQFMMVSFMFIGTLFNFRLRGILSKRGLIAGASVMLVLLFLTWPYTPIADQFPQITVNYLYGLLIFAACFALRGYFRPIRIIDFFADISYPLYLIHSISGYVLMRILIANSVPYYLAALTAFAAAVAMAYVVHRVIEMPTVNIWKRKNTWILKLAKLGSWQRMQDTDLPHK